MAKRVTYSRRGRSGARRDSNGWAELCAAWKHRCAYCDLPLREDGEWEHVEPISRGGEDERANLVPSCQSCNVKKRDLFLLEWVCVQYGLLINGSRAAALKVAPENHRPYPMFGLRHPSWAPSLKWIDAIKQEPK